jgi:phage shock protein A
LIIIIIIIMATKVSLSLSTIQSLFAEHTKALTDEIASLRSDHTQSMQHNKELSDEIANLRAEVRSLRDLLLDWQKTRQSALASTDISNSSTFADAVKNSVRSALDDEKHITRCHHQRPS